MHLTFCIEKLGRVDIRFLQHPHPGRMHPHPSHPFHRLALLIPLSAMQSSIYPFRRKPPSQSFAASQERCSSQTPQKCGNRGSVTTSPEENQSKGAPRPRGRNIEKETNRTRDRPCGSARHTRSRRAILLARADNRRARRRPAKRLAVDKPRRNPLPLPQSKRGCSYVASQPKGKDLLGARAAG